MEIAKQIAERVIAGDIDEVTSLTKAAIAQKAPIPDILEQGFVTGLDVIGEKFGAGEIFLPEMLMAAMAVKSGMDVLRPMLTEFGVKVKGTIVAGTVEGDVHDIGKNLVCMMCEGAGFRVINIGEDTPAEKFIKAAIENNADIIAMSALLSTTRENMKGIIQEIRASELKNGIKVMVGGAPLTQDFADSIGADGYAPDAGAAVKKAKELLGIG